MFLNSPKQCRKVKIINLALHRHIKQSQKIFLHLPLIDPVDEFCIFVVWTLVCIGFAAGLTLCGSNLEVHISNIRGVNI